MVEGVGVYEALGLTPLINAAGTKTRLGGIRMAQEVHDAMRAASDQSVDMAQLQGAASRTIARITGAEAGYATSGTACGLTLGAAACMTGLDLARIDRLPDTRDMPNEIVIPRSHRNSYDHAWRAAGAQLVEVGLDDRIAGTGARTLEAWEVAAAINPHTVAVAFVATRNNFTLLEQVIEVAHGHGVPVLVDAAAQLPPVENLRRFIDAGVDLVAFSGGKAIGGPQSTGFLAGRKHLVQAVMLNHLDLDVEFHLWSPPDHIFAEGELKALPRHGIGRGYKVSKEGIVGLLTALGHFAEGRWKAGVPAKERMATKLCAAVAKYEGVIAAIEEGYTIPRVELTFAASEVAMALYERLLAGRPAIALHPRDVAYGRLKVDTVGLTEEDGEVVIAEIERNLRVLSEEGQLV